MNLLVTRPEAEGAEMARALEALGHRVTLSPLMEVELLRPLIEIGGLQAILVTSKNAVRALLAQEADWVAAAQRLPIYAVGPGSARLARDSGFLSVFEGAAAGRELVRLIAETLAPAGGQLLHARGETIAFDLKGALSALGFTVSEGLFYEARPVEALTPAVCEAIRGAGGGRERLGVVLMSPRTASIFSRLVVKAGVGDAAAGVDYFCLSKGVAAGLGLLDPKRLHIAATPNAQEMLALITGQAPLSA